MNISWIDLLVIFLLVYNIIKGLNIGFIKSIFGIVQFVLIIYVMKIYYPYFYGYIKNIPILYNIFLIVFEFLMSIIFYKRIKVEPNFIEGILVKGAFEIFVNIVCLIIFSILIKWLLKLIFRFISFIFKAPILKQINKLLGLVFGLIKGILIIYILFIVFNSIAVIYPESFIGISLERSILLSFLEENNIIFNFLQL